jgi:4-amino-4-deoxy-L-arabinose transferase-like glycosyltransferase
VSAQNSFGKILIFSFSTRPTTNRAVMIEEISPKARISRFITFGALTVSLILAILAAFRGGYVGPDFNSHMSQMTNWSKIFDLGENSPPTYYLFGHVLYRLIGPNEWFLITLSIIQSAINAIAMWWFFLYAERRFQSALVEISFVLFLTFLPVRAIHSAVVGTDWMTIPVFVILLFLFERLLVSVGAINAIWFSLGLSLGICCKYTFMALIPAVFVVLLFVAWRRKWSLKRLAKIGLLALLLPTALTLGSFWASSRVHGFNTERHWLPKDAVADMNTRDLLTLKPTDLQLFKAPEYFKKEILTAHRYSYLGLAHLGVFTDTMNIFQELDRPRSFDPTLIPDLKTRRAWKTPVMQASMFLGLIWTVLALIGVAWGLVRAAKNLYRDQLTREDNALILGTAFFLLIFLSIPFVYAGALFGYWTPRLILPALLSFFWMGFLFLDRKTVAKPRVVGIVLLVLVALQSGIEIVMLA